MNDIDHLLAALLAERPEAAAIPDTLAEKRKLLRILMNIRAPVPLSPELAAIQDRELTTQIREKGIVDIEDIPASPLYPRLRLWQGDMTRLHVDAIVNPANSRLLGCFVPLHNCLDNAIHSMAGMQLREECNRIMTAQGHDERPGHAKITPGYNLPAKYVIHTVGPIVEGRTPTDDDRRLLANCYRSCLSLADKYALESLAFCCISTGVFRFPQEEAAEIAVSTVLDYFDQFPDSSINVIIFDVFKDEDMAIYRRLLGYQ